MSKLNSSHGFISLLYSTGDNPLGLWSKYVSSDGQVRRIEDETLNGDRVIEIRGPENSPLITNISCPASPIDRLNIKLPVLVMILKNLKARMKIDFQLIDEEDVRRRFVLSTYETSDRGGIVDHARIILKLEDDWNNLEIDLRHLCQSYYRTEYKALQRLIIYQNCRLRRIYLQDRHYKHNETPVQLCQAFFDMYMLKWGINFVEKSCQTHLTYAKDDDTTLLSPEMGEISRVRRSSKSISTVKPSSIRKILPSEGKRSARPRNDASSIDSGKAEKRTKTLIAETAKGKTMSIGQKAQSLGKIVSSKPAGLKKIVRNEDDENEGEIFRKWPYNYLQFQQIGQSVTTKLKTIDPTSITSKRANSAIGRDHFSSVVTSLNRQFPKNPVITGPIEITIPPEVEREAADESRKIIKTTKSKLLTTDEAVGDYLELRHVVNRKMLENFRNLGLTMTEVELSIYNPKNRRNSYGQGKLVEKHRTSVDKACNVVTREETTKKRDKSATNVIK